jgi:uncharacterized protein (TIRG00374 family)
VLQAVGSILAMLAIGYFAFTKFTSFSDVWANIRELTWLEAATLVAIAVWNIVTYWFVMVAALPGSNYWQAMKINQTSTAVANTLPGGGAIGIGVTYSMYSAYGFSHPSIGLSIVVSGIWNNFVKLGMPVLALALVAIQGNASAARVTAAGVGVLVLGAAIAGFALALRSDSIARRLGEWLAGAASFFKRLVGKGPAGAWGDAFVRFRRETLDLLRRRWAWLSIASIVSHLSLYAVLLLTLRHVGVSEAEVGWAEVLAVFAFIRLISAIPITPGGLGVVEVGLTAGLVAAGGARPEVVAGVLVYRVLTWALPIPLGIALYMKWIRGAEARRERVEQQRQSDLPIAVADERPA